MDKQIGAIGVDNAMIETARINLGYCVIRAPFDGRVSFYQLNVGNLVQVANQTGIISITQTRPISVVLTLPEADLPQIQACSWQRLLFRSRYLTVRVGRPAGRRHIDDAQQHDRYHHRHDLPEGDLR